MSFVLMDRVMKVAGLAPFERGVLVNLAWRADRNSSTCWPSIARVVADTGISERQVFRALKSLRMKGLIVSTGSTKHGTTIYMVVIPDPALSTTVKDEMAVPTCHPDCSSLPPWHTNKDTEHGKGTESIYTSPEEPGLACAPAPAPQKAIGQDQPPQPSWPKLPAPPATMAGDIAKDSKVVAEWKLAHQKAGLHCIVSARIGHQLGLLSNAAPPVPYHDVIGVLIPIAVTEWASMCLYLAGYFGVALWGKKPMPTVPHAGFLLKFRKEAFAYCSMDTEMRKHMVKLCAKPLASANDTEPAHPLEYE
jgi:hypothetical protein